MHWFKSLFTALIVSLCFPVMAFAQPVSDQQFVEQRRLIDLIESRALENSGGEKNATYHATLELGLSLLTGLQDDDLTRSTSSIDARILALTPEEDFVKYVQTNADATAAEESLELFKRNERILNGGRVPMGSLKSTVALAAKRNETGCTGVVIGDGIALTAAHCVCDLGLGKAGIAVGSGGWVYFGNASPLVSNNSTEIINAYAMNRDQSCRKDVVCVPDIGIVFFDPDAGGDATKPARIATKDEVTEHLGSLKTRTVIAGFGYVRAPSNEDHDSKSTLLATYKKFARPSNTYFCPPSSQCSTSPVRPGCRSPIDLIVNDIAASDVSYASDACSGDSGGPAYLSDALQLGAEERVFGVISRAHDPKGRCGYGTVISDVFTEEVRTWIDGRIAAHRQKFGN